MFLLLLMLFWVHCRIAVLNDLFTLRQFSAYRKSYCIHWRKSDCNESVSICVQCSNIIVAWWGSSNEYASNIHLYAAHLPLTIRYTHAHVHTMTVVVVTERTIVYYGIHLHDECILQYGQDESTLLRAYQHAPVYLQSHIFLDGVSSPFACDDCLEQKTKRSMFKCQFIVCRRLEMMFNIFVIIWKSINTFVLLLPYFGFNEKFCVFFLGV